MKRQVGFIGFTAAVFSAIFLYGCGNSSGPTETLSNSYGKIVAQEIVNMTNNVATIIGTPGFCKRAADDTVYFDWAKPPQPAWDAVNSLYFRAFTDSSADGTVRVRIDTFSYVDINSASMEQPFFTQVDTVKISRTVTCAVAGKDFNLTINLFGKLSITPDTELVMHGAVSGTIGTDAITSATAQGLTRSCSYSNTKLTTVWTPMTAGTVTLEFAKATYTITFTGSQQATLKVTSKTSSATKTETAVAIPQD